MLQIYKYRCILTVSVWYHETKFYRLWRSFYVYKLLGKVIWYRDRIKYPLRRWIERKIIIPINSKKEPIALYWVDYYNGAIDMIIPQGEPQCPRCGEMPYNTEQCVFCGQRFIEEQEEE
jgi:hypothetical protein